MTEPTMPTSVQAAAVRQMLLEDTSDKSFADKLAAIKASHPSLADGVAAVLEEGENPKRAGSGSAPHETLGLADMV